MKLALTVTVLALFVAFATAAPKVKAAKEPCLYPGEYVADDTTCEVYYVCDDTKFPVQHVCPAASCFYENACVDNRPLCNCTIT